jgi:hypothetical protein
MHSPSPSKNSLWQWLKTRVSPLSSAKTRSSSSTKSLISGESGTPTDSISPHNAHRNLCSWLQESQTQRLLADLEALAESLNQLVLDRVPASREQEMLREQSIGEIRGLRRLHLLVAVRKEELEEEIRRLEQTGEQSSN